MTQAVVNAVVLAIAYVLGSFIGFGVRVLWNRGSRHLPAVTRRVAWVVLGIGWLIGLAVGIPLWLVWQNDQRAIMGMAALDGVDALLMVVLSIVIGVVLVVVGRLIGSAVVGLVRLSRRVMPSLRAAVPVGLAVFGVLLGFVGWAAWEGVTALAESTHRAQNAGSDEGTLQPESRSVSGSVESLVAWDTLGRQGRNFASGATSLEQLRLFHEPNAALIEPVRVYVGLDSAESVLRPCYLRMSVTTRHGACVHCRWCSDLWPSVASSWFVFAVVSAWMRASETGSGFYRRGSLVVRQAAGSRTLPISQCAALPSCDQQQHRAADRHQTCCCRREAPYATATG